MHEYWGLVEAEVATRYPGLGNPLREPWMRLRRLIENLPADSPLWIVGTGSAGNGAQGGPQGASGPVELRRPAWRDQLELALHGKVTPNVRVISEEQFLRDSRYFSDFGSGTGKAPLMR